MVIVNHIALNRNRDWGGVLIYIREDIPSKPLADHNLPDDIEGSFVELNPRKKKWLLFRSYHPPNHSDQYFLHQVKKSLDMYSKFYKRCILIRDFHAEQSESFLSQFLFEMNAKILLKVL